MKPIIRRLQKLEELIPAPAPVRSGPSAAGYFTERLARLGVVREEHESLAETIARALGITTWELRVQLQRRAAGLPAE